MPAFEPPTSANGEWHVDEPALEAITLGAAILGTGGGGSPYIGWLRTRQQLRAGRQINVVRLEDLDDGDLIIPTSSIGAPTVSNEKIERGDECLRAVEVIEDYLGREAVAVVTDEIGGSNALEPMIVAALKDIAVVDADAMGRAFPELQMSTFFIYGLQPYPTALADEKNNHVLFKEATSPVWLERAARAVTIQMGCHAGMAGPPMTVAQAKKLAIPGTVRQAWRLGQTVLEARTTKRNPISEVIGLEGGSLLLRGKIVDVNRRTTQGFARGTMTLEGFDQFEGKSYSIEFQNENLICRAAEQILATVPDLICVLDSETATPVTTEELRYGFRVSVIGLPAPPQLTTPEALEVVGPRAFNLDADYRPLAFSQSPA
jgi:uncharacterized protein